MELSNLFELLLSSELEKYLFNRKELNIGDKLQGKVIEIKENGKVLIDFIKFRTVAKVKFPIKVGETIDVKVVDKGENLKFTLEEKNKNIIVDSKEIIKNIKSQNSGDIEKLVDALKNVFSDTKETENISENINKKGDFIKNKSDGNIDIKRTEIGGKEIKNNQRTDFVVKTENIPPKIKSIIDVMSNQFKPLGPAEDILKNVALLKKQIDNSGIFFEKKLAAILEKMDNMSKSILKLANNGEIKSVIQNDLKPNLLVLKDFFIEENFNQTGVKQKQLGVIRETLDDLINNIGKQQETAVKKHSNIDTMQYFTFNIPMKDKKKAKLRVYYNKKSKKKSLSKGFNLSLLLIMDNLGEIRTDFFLLKKDLNITFFVMDEEIKTKFKQKLNLIKEPLSNLFRFLNINVIVSKRKIREFESEEIKGEDVKLGLIDLSV